MFCYIQQFSLGYTLRKTSKLTAFNASCLKKYKSKSSYCFAVISSSCQSTHIHPMQKEQGTGNEQHETPWTIKYFNNIFPLQERACLN